MTIRDRSYRGVHRAAWICFVLAALGGHDLWVRPIGIALAVLAGVGTLLGGWLERRRPIPSDPLAGVRVERATYVGTGGSLVLRDQNGRRRRLDWRNAEEMAAALRRAGTEPEVQRFELGAWSKAAFVLGVLVVGSVSGYAAIFAIPARFPALLAWPWMALLVLGGFALMPGVAWATTTSAELTPDALRLRVGPRMRVVRRAPMPDVALTETTVLVRTERTTIRVPTTEKGTAWRLIRVLAEA